MKKDYANKQDRAGDAPGKNTQTDNFVCGTVYYPVYLAFKLAIYLLIATFLVIPGLTFGVPGIQSIESVYAAGANVTILTIPSSGYAKVLLMSGGPYTWNDLCTRDSVDTAGTIYPLGEHCAFACTGNAAEWGIQKSIIAFDLTTVLNQISDINAIKSVRLITGDYCTIAGGTPFDWIDSYLSFYKTVDSDWSITGADWSEAKKSNNIAVFQYKGFYDLPSSAGSTTYWNMYSQYLWQFLSWRDTHNYIYFTFSPMRVQLNAQPTTWNGVIVAAGGSVSPTLEITYIPSAPTRTVWHKGNTGGNNPLLTGNETADNITWESPRCAYADEDISFYINGQWGANVTMQLIDDKNVLLANHNDFVHSDGTYNWVIPAGTLPTTYSGWIRVKETNFNLVSNWGRVEPSPSANEKNLNVYAVDTNYPQYDYPFITWCVKEDNIMEIHWKTNIASSEVTNYGIDLYTGGDNVTGWIYDSGLDNLNTGYYMCSSNNSFLSAWRYMLFTPKASTQGFNNANGLIVNLNEDYSAVSSGFILPLIRSRVDNSVLTDTNSCYYYLQNPADGIAVSIDSQLMAMVTVGAPSKVADKLSYIDVEELDSGYNLVGSVTGQAIVGTVQLQLPMITTAGNYKARFVLYDDMKTPYYSYIIDLPFAAQVTQNPNGTTTTTTTPGEPGGTGGTNINSWLDWITNFLKSHNLDNEAGHWLLIFILCIAIIILTRKVPLAMCIMLVIIFAGAFLAKWLNPWFIVLMSIIVGFIGYGLFRKKEQGNT
jgi:hypothetical protein